MSKQSLLFVLLAAVVSLKSSMARADLILNFDPGTKMLSFSGSDSGNIRGGRGGVGILDWTEPCALSASLCRPDLNDPLSVDLSVLTTSGETNITSISIRQIGAGIPQFKLQLFFDTGNVNTTLTGTGIPFSYAGSTQGPELELSGTKWGDWEFGGGGTGFADLGVNANVTAVPEPSGFVGCCVAFAIAFHRRRSTNVST